MPNISRRSNKMFVVRKVPLSIIISIVLIFSIGAIFGLTLPAKAALLSRINQAMREAGIAVTATHQLAWAEGVVVGHYKSYRQLVDAMKWHKSIGRSVPDRSKLTKKATTIVKKVTSKKKFARGTVTAVRRPSKTRAGYITVAGIVFKMPPGSYVAPGIQVGSTVKIAYTGVGKIRNGINIKDLSLEPGTAGLEEDGGGGGDDNSGDCPYCPGDPGDDGGGT